MTTDNSVETVKAPATKTTKSAKKVTAVKKATPAKAAKKTEKSDSKIFGKNRSGMRGKILIHLVAKKSIDVKQVGAIAGNKDVNATGILYSLRADGKSEGTFNLFPSTKQEGKWIFKEGKASKSEAA